MTATTDALDLASEEHSLLAGEPAPPTGKQVAVVGAGMAGMACAIRLALLGNGVVLYEARSRERETMAASASDQALFARLVAQGEPRLVVSNG